MQILRLTPPEGQKPWLIRAWTPCPGDPFKAEAWEEDKPMSQQNSRKARSILLTLHPLLMSEEGAKQAAAYRGRRVQPSVAGCMGLSAQERAALSNWKDVGRDREASREARSMPSHYDASKLGQSLSSKWLCTRGIQEACQKKRSFNVHMI